MVMTIIMPSYKRERELKNRKKKENQGAGQEKNQRGLWEVAEPKKEGERRERKRGLGSGREKKTEHGREIFGDFDRAAVPEERQKLEKKKAPLPASPLLWKGEEQQAAAHRCQTRKEKKRS